MNTFNWLEFLQQENISKEQLEHPYHLVRHWDACAIGAHPDYDTIEKHDTLSPEDYELYKLGMEFSSVISRWYVDYDSLHSSVRREMHNTALQLLHQIDVRYKQLVSEPVLEEVC